MTIRLLSGLNSTPSKNTKKIGNMAKQTKTPKKSSNIPLSPSFFSFKSNLGLKSSVFGLTLLFSACNSIPDKSSDSEPIIITQDILKTTDSQLDELIRINNIIPLETSKDAIVGEHVAISISETGIIIADYVHNQILVFYPDGSFRCKIDQQGKGPGEYSSISGQDWILCQDHSKKQTLHDIVIADRSGKKLLFFTADGQFISETETAIPVHKVGALSARLIACHTGRFNAPDSEADSISQLRIVTRQGELVKEFFQYTTPLVYEMGVGFTNGIEGGQSYFKMFDPTIYQINPDLSLGVNWQFDFGSLKADTIKFFKPGVEGIRNFETAYGAGEILDIGSIYQTNKTLFISLFGFNIRHQLAINNITRDLFVFKSDSAGNMVYVGGIPVKPPKTVSTESFVCSFTAIDWIEYLSKLNIENLTENRKEIPGFSKSENIKEEDNPVLIFYSLSRS
jgi:hypothetical protein